MVCAPPPEVLKLNRDWHFRDGPLTMTKTNLREVICPSVGKYQRREWAFSSLMTNPCVPGYFEVKMAPLAEGGVGAGAGSLGGLES